MRHLQAKAGVTRLRPSLHLQATAKVQIFVERSKGGRGAEVERGGTRENANMIGDCAVMLTKRKPPERSG